MTSSWGSKGAADKVFVKGEYARTGKKAIGEFWEVGFKHKYTVHLVRVLSYDKGSSFGHNRLGKVKVLIDSQECGDIKDGTKGDGTWYEVVCKKPVSG